MVYRNKHFMKLLVTVCPLQWWIKHEEPVVSSETSQSAGVRAILPGVTNCPCDHDPHGVFYAPVNPNPVRLWTLIPCPSKPKRWTEIYSGRRCPTSSWTSYPLHWCPFALRWNRFKHLSSSKPCNSCILNVNGDPGELSASCPGLVSRPHAMPS